MKVLVLWREIADEDRESTLIGVATTLDVATRLVQADIDERAATAANKGRHLPVWDRIFVNQEPIEWVDLREKYGLLTQAWDCHRRDGYTYMLSEEEVHDA